MSIAFEEMAETLFWFEVVSHLKFLKADKMTLILNEANELTRILAASRKTSQSKLRI